MKRKYRVNFYFGTDLRSSIDVEAYSEVFALIKALDQIHEAIWCDVLSTKVTIEILP